MGRKKKNVKLKADRSHVLQISNITTMRAEEKENNTNIILEFYYILYGKKA